MFVSVFIVESDLCMDGFQSSYMVLYTVLVLQWSLVCLQLWLFGLFFNLIHSLLNSEPFGLAYSVLHESSHSLALSDTDAAQLHKDK